MYIVYVTRVVCINISIAKNWEVKVFGNRKEEQKALKLNFALDD